MGLRPKKGNCAIPTGVGDPPFKSVALGIYCCVTDYIKLSSLKVNSFYLTVSLHQGSGSSLSVFCSRVSQELIVTMLGLRLSEVLLFFKNIFY